MVYAIFMLLVRRRLRRLGSDMRCSCAIHRHPRRMLAHLVLDMTTPLLSFSRQIALR
jgi:hypothetical protein